MTSGTVAALFATMFVIAIVPGPSDFAVVARSTAAGFRHGLMMVAGIVVADALYIVAAVYGLSALAAQVGGLLVFAKYVCGVYLFWLGARLWGSRPVVVVGADEAAMLSHSSSFVTGFVITLGDPKAFMFYLGLLPAFLDLSRVSIADIVTVVLVATVVICVVKLTYAYMGDRARHFFQSPRAKKTLDVAAGSVLIGVGAFLLLRG